MGAIVLRRGKQAKVFLVAIKLPARVPAHFAVETYRETRHRRLKTERESLHRSQQRGDRISTCWNGRVAAIAGVAGDGIARVQISAAADGQTDSEVPRVDIADVKRGTVHRQRRRKSGKEREAGEGIEMQPGIAGIEREPAACGPGSVCRVVAAV